MNSCTFCSRKTIAQQWLFHNFPIVAYIDKSYSYDPIISNDERVETEKQIELKINKM